MTKAFAAILLASAFVAFAAAQDKPAPPRAIGLRTASPPSHDLIEKLLAMGAEIQAPNPIKSIDQLPDGDIVVKSVTFTKYAITGDGLAAVAGCNVETLSLRGGSASRLTPADWGRLEGANLRKFDLTGQPKAGMFSALAKVQSLEEINMAMDNGSAHKDEIASLGALPNLHYLRLSHVPVTGATFAKWPARPALKNLLIPDSGSFDDAGLQALLNAAPNLTELSVGAVLITDARIEILGKFASLKVFRVPRKTPDGMIRKLSAALPKAKVELREDSRY